MKLIHAIGEKTPGPTGSLPGTLRVQRYKCYHFQFQATYFILTLGSTTGCPKINETHNIANKHVDFNPIVYIFQI